MADPGIVRYALSGLGKRSWNTYLPALSLARGCRHQLVSVVDSMPQRLAHFHEHASASVPAYLATDFDRMLAEVAPDVVVVASPDYAHVDQILATLARDRSVISEKPMVLDAAQAARVIAAAEQSTGSITVTHNLRCLNLNLRIKELLAESCIGRITNVWFAYHLTPGHGASYFCRWHRHRDASGGLPITKGCHHFDLLNWWLADTPVDVFSWTARGHFHPGAPVPNDALATVPLDADIEDTIAALIRYRQGALVSYAMSGCSTWEGYSLTIHGTEGTLSATYDKLATDDHVICVQPLDGPKRMIREPREEGRHSGADRRMIAALFGGASLADDDAPRPLPLPGAHEAALAVAIGDAIIRSARGNAPVAPCALLDNQVHGQLKESA